MGEVLLIAAIALIAIGPKQLPEVARVVGRLLNDFRRATGDFQKAFFDAKSEADNTIHNFQRSIEESLTPKNPQSQIASQENHTPTEEAPKDDAEQLSFDINKKGS